MRLGWRIEPALNLKNYAMKFSVCQDVFGRRAIFYASGSAVLISVSHHFDEVRKF
jgi:hypothetical protein